MKDPDLVPFPRAYEPTLPEPPLPPVSEEAIEYKKALKAHPRLRRFLLAVRDTLGPSHVRRAWRRIQSGGRERFAELFSE